MTRDRATRHRRRTATAGSRRGRRTGRRSRGRRARRRGGRPVGDGGGSWRGLGRGVRGAVSVQRRRGAARRGPHAATLASCAGGTASWSHDVPSRSTPAPDPPPVPAPRRGRAARPRRGAARARARTTTPAGHRRGRPAPGELRRPDALLREGAQGARRRTGRHATRQARLRPWFRLRRRREEEPVAADGAVPRSPASRSRSPRSAVLQLVERGRCELDEPVLESSASYKPHLAPGRETRPALEAGDRPPLLQHTGGWDRDQKALRPDRHPAADREIAKHQAAGAAGTTSSAT